MSGIRRQGSKAILANLAMAALVGSTVVIVAQPGSAAVPGAAATPIAFAAPSGGDALPNVLGLGVASSPGGTAWMTSSGVGWSYRYQYLAGGANSGSGWATWNTNGDFASYYMQDSFAAGYIPVFSYYQLLQSSPSSGANEGERTYNNLQNASTMAAYYADFKLLMDKVRAYGRPVIIHVEPDLSGFLEQRVVGGTNSAASIPAKVGASGYAPVAGLPDTYQGFNLALLKLRDLYAPNAVMATHVSAWAGGVDIGTTTDVSLDVSAAASRIAGFLNTAGAGANAAGVSRYDLLFFDPSDRDAGFYQNVYGDGGAHWWDTTNATFPNFSRYQQFVAATTAATGLKAMLWQVPVGNTIMRTENNSWGHYQDNRVQYWLGGYPSDGHLASLASAGVIGVLFGPGAAGPTSFEDVANDGVTNPAAVNGNTRLSTVSDDDGGYLREQAKAYYAAPIVLGASPPATTSTVPPSPSTTSSTTSTLPSTTTSTSTSTTSTSTTSTSTTSTSTSSTSTTSTSTSTTVPAPTTVMTTSSTRAPTTSTTVAPRTTTTTTTTTTTIPSTTIPSPTTTVGPGSIPVPGAFRSVDYRSGGELVGYHDTTPGNTGAAYRSDDVDIQSCSDGAGCLNVGWIASGEWLAYDVQVAKAGSYAFTIRTASPYRRMSFHIELDGKNVSGSIVAPYTGGWDLWKSVRSAPIAFPAGRHVVRIVADVAGYNIGRVTVG